MDSHALRMLAVASTQHYHARIMALDHIDMDGERYPPVVIQITNEVEVTFEAANGEIVIPSTHTTIMANDKTPSKKNEIKKKISKTPKGHSGVKGSGAGLEMEAKTNKNVFTKDKALQIPKAQYEGKVSAEKLKTRATATAVNINGVPATKGTDFKDNYFKDDNFSTAEGHALAQVVVVAKSQDSKDSEGAIDRLSIKESAEAFAKAGFNNRGAVDDFEFTDEINIDRLSIKESVEAFAKAAFKDSKALEEFNFKDEGNIDRMSINEGVEAVANNFKSTTVIKGNRVFTNVRTTPEDDVKDGEDVDTQVSSILHPHRGGIYLPKRRRRNGFYSQVADVVKGFEGGDGESETEDAASEPQYSARRRFIRLRKRPLHKVSSQIAEGVRASNNAASVQGESSLTAPAKSNTLSRRLSAYLPIRSPSEVAGGDDRRRSVGVPIAYGLVRNAERDLAVTDPAWD